MANNQKQPSRYSHATRILALVLSILVAGSAIYIVIGMIAGLFN